MSASMTLRPTAVRPVEAAVVGGRGNGAASMCSSGAMVVNRNIFKFRMYDGNSRIKALHVPGLHAIGRERNRLQPSIQQDSTQPAHPTAHVKHRRCIVGDVLDEQLCVSSLRRDQVVEGDVSWADVDVVKISVMQKAFRQDF